jgi:hypothetical protein
MLTSTLSKQASTLKKPTTYQKWAVKPTNNGRISRMMQGQKAGPINNKRNTENILQGYVPC